MAKNIKKAVIFVLVFFLLLSPVYYQALLQLFTAESSDNKQAKTVQNAERTSEKSGEEKLRPLLVEDFKKDILRDALAILEYLENNHAQNVRKYVRARQAADPSWTEAKGAQEEQERENRLAISMEFLVQKEPHKHSLLEDYLKQWGNDPKNRRVAVWLLKKIIKEYE